MSSKRKKKELDIESLSVSRGTKLAMETVFKIRRDYENRTRRKRRHKVPKDHDESFELYGDCRVPGCKCDSRPIFARMRF